MLGWLEGALPGFWLGLPQLPGFWLGLLPLPGFWVGLPPLPAALELLGWSPVCRVSVARDGLSAGSTDRGPLVGGDCGPATHVTTDEAPAAARTGSSLHGLRAAWSGRED